MEHHLGNFSRLQLCPHKLKRLPRPISSLRLLRPISSSLRLLRPISSLRLPWGQQGVPRSM
jgi:hypothetical protein